MDGMAHKAFPAAIINRFKLDRCE